MNCSQIEVAIANYFDVRKNLIVPNISWGAGLHECDLLIITKSGYATEVEIKVSKADLKKDFKKGHNHIDERIKALFYAVPEKLLPIALELVPDTAGIFVCKWREEVIYYEGTINEWRTPARAVAVLVRNANPTHKFRAMNPEEINNIMRLGCMRIFSLKDKINARDLKIKELAKPH